MAKYQNMLVVIDPNGTTSLHYGARCICTNGLVDASKPFADL